MYFLKKLKNDHFIMITKKSQKIKKIKYTVELKIISGCLQCVVHIRKVTEYNSIIL